MNCPYCNKKAVVKDSSVIYYGRSFGLVWICPDYPKCDSYVGIHKNSKRMMPLGRMANRELRELKKEVHAVFDTLWKTKQMSRNLAYTKLREGMKMDKGECHIGKFDNVTCRRAIEVATEIIKQIQSEHVEQSI